MPEMRGLIRDFQPLYETGREGPGLRRRLESES